MKNRFWGVGLEDVLGILVSFVKYSIVGALTVATQVALFIFLAQTMKVSGLASYTAAVAGSLVVAYFAQSRWTFAERTYRSPGRYITVVIICFCIGSTSTWLIVDWARLSPYWALPVMVVAIPIISFSALRAWVFREAFRENPVCRRDRT